MQQTWWDLGKPEDFPRVHYHPLKKYQTKAIRARNSNPLHCLVTRTDWGAARPTSEQQLHTPAPFFMKLPPATQANHIHFSHTATEECGDEQECARVLRGLQEKEMSSGKPDISHSFIVGGDGKVYEGRGWFTQAEVPEEFTTILTAALQISVIGDFSKKKPPKLMVDTMKKLFEWGIVNNKLYCCYTKTFNMELHNMYYK